MSLSGDRWTYLDPYTRKYLSQRLEAYDQIMKMTKSILDDANSINNNLGLDDLENKFIRGLISCLQLNKYLNQPSSIPGKSLELWCEVAQKPAFFLELTFRYLDIVKLTEQEIKKYASSVDNWKISNYPFGIKDHCNILIFLLNIGGSIQEQSFFRGSDLTPEIICEFLKDWKGIDLTMLLPKATSVSH
jgi:hypothetical protein